MFSKFNPLSTEHIKLFGQLYELYRTGKSPSTAAPDAESLWKNTHLWHDSNELSLRFLQYFAQKHADRFADVVGRHSSLDLSKDFPIPLAASALTQMMAELFPVPSLISSKDITMAKIFRVLYEDTKALEEVFCVAFLLFDRAWVTQSHTALPFKMPECLRLVKEKMQAELSKEPPAPKKKSSSHKMDAASPKKSRRGSDSSDSSTSSASSSSAAASATPYLDRLKALAAKQGQLPTIAANGAEDPAVIWTWGREKLLSKFATWSQESTRSPAESGDRIQAIRRLEQILDLEERDHPETDAGADDDSGKKSKDKKDKKDKKEKSKSAAAKYGWGSLTPQQVHHVVWVLMNASKYEDRSLLMPHLLSHNRILFKATLSFLSKLVKKAPVQAPHIAVAARKLNELLGNNSPLENFVESARLNNNNVVEQTLDIVLEMMEADPSVGPELMAANFMEPLSAFAAHCIEPPQSLLKMQRILLSRFTDLAGRALNPTKSKADLDILVDFWRQSFPEQAFKAESDGYKSKQWMLLGFDDDDPLKEFKNGLAPVLSAAFGRLRRDEYQEIVQNRIYQRTFDYNFVRGAIDVAQAFYDVIIQDLVKIDDLIQPLFASAAMLEELFCVVWAAFDLHWTKKNVEDKPALRQSIATTAARVVRTLFYTEKDVAAIRKRALDEMNKDKPGENMGDLSYHAARALSASANDQQPPSSGNLPPAPASPPKAGNDSPASSGSTVSARLRRITVLAANRAGSEPSTPVSDAKRKKGPPSSNSSADLSRGRSATEREATEKTGRAYRKDNSKLPKVVRSATESPRGGGGGGADSESESIGM
eukprot:TRINITY_DN1256_c0_g1_i2.p1 TRINITY_DN1256_c0_g1~~TRINITY_DN1256_c0_g1_i2.p1  ORF type:complete len:823 (-),score=190.84 TRINITY_DN1256_c0_g1_i2:38-2506(-)